jgi:hypothetical protein
MEFGNEKKKPVILSKAKPLTKDLTLFFGRAWERGQTRKRPFDSACWEAEVILRISVPREMKVNVPIAIESSRAGVDDGMRSGGEPEGKATLPCVVILLCWAASWPTI